MIPSPVKAPAYENPLKPMSFKMTVIIGAVICGILFGWYALENFTDYRLTSRWQRLGGSASEAVVGSHAPKKDPLPLLVPVVGCPLIMLAIAGWIMSMRRLEKHGHLSTATVLRAKSLNSARVVTFSYVINGKTKKTKKDLLGTWADHVRAGDQLDIILLGGFFGGIHILGRSKVNAMLNAIKPPPSSFATAPTVGI